MPALSRPHGPADRERRRRECAAESSAVEVRGRGDLDDLLVPPLDRAVALEEVDEVAVLVAEQLHLDVPGALDELLEEDVGDAERGAGLAAGLVEGLVELVGGRGRRACRGRRRPSTP